MTIESSLERIAIALEDFAKPFPVSAVDENVQQPEVNPTPAPTLDPEAETGQVPSLDDVRAAIAPFLPDRREEAIRLMKSFGAEAVREFNSSQYTEVIDKFNTAFNS